MSIQATQVQVLRAIEDAKYGYLEVSHGTLQTFDLFHAFKNTLKRFAPNGYITKKRLGYFFVPKTAKYDDQHPFWDTEDAQIIVGQMFDALDSFSPEGYYFGTCKGDSSCFGWWKVDDSEFVDFDGNLLK